MPARRILATALVFLATWGFLLSPAWSPEAGSPRGHLLIVGGGETPPDALARFVELAGGREWARIAVFPMASTSADESAAETVVELESLGATAFVFNLSREEAESEAVAKQLEGVTGFWFAGGDQTRLATTLISTPALAAVQQRYYEGAIVGGTSAGAAIMSSVMLTGNRYRNRSIEAIDDDEEDDDHLPVGLGSFEIIPGLGFLPGTIVDQHFLRRSRHNRLLSAILERPGRVGLGIDEETAVLVRPDGYWEVLGNSYVNILDARRSRMRAQDRRLPGASDISLHLLPAGSVYDPIRGRATLPPG